MTTENLLIYSLDKHSGKAAGPKMCLLLEGHLAISFIFNLMCLDQPFHDHIFILRTQIIESFHGVHDSYKHKMSVNKMYVWRYHTIQQNTVVKINYVFALLAKISINY